MALFMHAVFFFAPKMFWHFAARHSGKFVYHLFVVCLELHLNFWITLIMQTLRRKHMQ